MAIEILRGQWAPGATLPSIRTLATRFSTTVPTIQRAIERLAAVGLVTVRRGSGITVNNPKTAGDFGLLPLWFDALQDQPARCARILGDFLTVRRVMARQLISAHRGRILLALPRMAMAAAPLATTTDLMALARADAAITQAVVEAGDNFAMSIIFNNIARLASDVPLVAEALYGDRQAHQTTIAEVIAAVSTHTSSEDAATALVEALAAWDVRTVKRFENLLRDKLRAES